MMTATSILMLSLFLATHCQEFGQIKFGGAPDLNDEETSSFHMPEQFKCDGCKIMAHMFFESFRREERKLPKGKSLSESQIIDVTEKVCSSEFMEYGVTEWNGERRLKGPGLDTDNVPGVAQSGGKWPLRLQQLCNSYIDELGEDFIYRKHQRSSVHPSTWSRSFTVALCEESGRHLSHCQKTKSEL